MQAKPTGEVKVVRKDNLGLNHTYKIRVPTHEHHGKSKWFVIGAEILILILVLIALGCCIHTRCCKTKEVPDQGQEAEPQEVSSPYRENIYSAKQRNSLNYEDRNLLDD